MSELSSGSSAPTRATFTLASVFYVVGLLATVMASGMLLPTFVALADNTRTVAVAFAATALASAFLGAGLMVAMQGGRRPATVRENILLLALAWGILPVLGAMPLLASGALPRFTDAYFEAMSALTTTGASVIADPGAESRAVLLWRALMQWGGGFASVLMALAVLSAFGTTGRDVQRTSLPLGTGGATALRFAHFSRALAALYLAVTGLGIAGFWAAGIPPFDAICLAMSSVSTGGMTTRADGFGAFHAPLAEAVAVLLMLFGATNFMTHWAVLRRGVRRYAEDLELGYLLFTVAVGFVLLGIPQLIHLGALETLKLGGATVFNVVSLVTTTGYWLSPSPHPSGAAALVALGLATIGGATLSTTGGVKLLRLALLTLQGRRELHRLSHPRSVNRILYNGFPVDERVIVGLSAFVAAYGLLLAGAALALAGLGLTPASSLTAAAAALANAGPLYDSIGQGLAPYGSMPDPAKWLLAAVMAAGRLEVLALLSIFSPALWRG